MSDVLVVGNPFDGMAIVGPFDHPEDASSYAEKFCGGEDWHMVPVEEPDPAFDNWDKLPSDLDKHGDKSIDALETELDAQEIDYGILDDMVHEAASRQASATNNAGMNEQLHYLVYNGFTLDEIKQEIARWKERERSRKTGQLHGCRDTVCWCHEPRERSGECSQKPDSCSHCGCHS